MQNVGGMGVQRKRCLISAKKTVHGKQLIYRELGNHETKLVRSCRKERLLSGVKLMGVMTDIPALQSLLCFLLAF